MINDMIRVKTNAQINAEKQKQIDDFYEKEKQPHISGLAAYVKRCFEAARQARQEVETRMLQAMRQRRGEYDSDILTEISEQGGSDIYMLLTSMKCRAAESWINEIVFPAGDRSWDLKPTTEPEMRPDIAAAIEDKVYQVATMIMQGDPMAVIPPDQVEEMKKRLEDLFMDRLQEEARKVADRMERKIVDQLEEGNYELAMKEVIKDVVTFPAAILKGPVIRRTKQLSWERKMGRFQPVVKEKLQKTFKRVSPFDIYPSPTAKNEREGYIIERHRLSRTDLTEMLDVQGYNNGGIYAVLKEFGMSGLQNWLLNDSERQRLESRPNEWLYKSDIIEALEFYGSISGKHLIEFGMDRAKVPDPLAEYECCVWLVGPHVIKATINEDPLRRRPYYRACFEEIPGSFWGYGVPDLVRDVQNMCNAASRALANNMAIASGPMVEAHTDRMAEGEDVESIYPWRVFQTRSDPNGTNNPAIRFHNPNPIAEVLIRVYEFFSRLADEHSGIPAYTYGGAKVGGAGRTASGLSMLMTAAGRGIKQVVSHIDRMTIGVITRMYDLNMLYEEDESIKGDLKVNAKGSSSIIAKEQQQIRRTEFLQQTANPFDMQILGIEGRADLLREAVKSLDIPPGVVPDKDKVLARMRQAALLQLPQEQGQQALPQGGGMPGGGTELDVAGNPAGGVDQQLFQ